MKIPTMDQLRIRHELAMVGAHEDWEALFNECVTYGRACGQVLFKPTTTETYGRGEMPKCRDLSIDESHRMLRRLRVLASSKPLLAMCYARWWDYAFTLDDFPRSPLAGAVSRAVSA